MRSGIARALLLGTCLIAAGCTRRPAAVDAGRESLWIDCTPPRLQWVEADTAHTGPAPGWYVEGIVIDAESNQPREAASVHVPGTSLDVLTNRYGRFSLRVQDTGQIIVRARMIHHLPSPPETVTVTSAVGATRVLRLQRDPRPQKCILINDAMPE